MALNLSVVMDYSINGRPPKILLLGDYSNCHRTLGTGLRRLGCDVTIASDGSRWMDCRRDIDIARKPGKVNGLLHTLRMHGLLRTSLSGYDIVAVHDPVFTTLRPERLRPLLALLQKRNRSLFYTAMSTDSAFLDMLAAPDSPLRYSEWFVDGKPSRMYLDNPAKWDEWHAEPLRSYEENFFDIIDGAVSVLYEYQLGMERRLGTERSAYGGIPIDLELFEPVELPDNISKVKFFLGRDRNRKLMKGSDLLETAAQEVVRRHPDKAELVIVENRPFDEFIGLLKDSHVVLDQIYSYTPATTALMAMAYGLNVVSGAEPEYYDFIGEFENRPIVNAPIELGPLTNTLEDIVLHPERIRERGLRSREFVEKHNRCGTVAGWFLDFWLERLDAKTRAQQQEQFRD